jgi:hypothetical protein
MTFAHNNSRTTRRLLLLAWCHEHVPSHIHYYRQDKGIGVVLVEDMPVHGMPTSRRPPAAMQAHLPNSRSAHRTKPNSPLPSQLYQLTVPLAKQMPCMKMCGDRSSPGHLELPTHGSTLGGLSRSNDSRSSLLNSLRCSAFSVVSSALANQASSTSSGISNPSFNMTEK